MSAITRERVRGLRQPSQTNGDVEVARDRAKSEGEGTKMDLPVRGERERERERERKSREEFSIRVRRFPTARGTIRRFTDVNGQPAQWRDVPRPLLAAVSITDSTRLSRVLFGLSSGETQRHRHLGDATHDVTDALNQRRRTLPTRRCMYLTAAGNGYPEPSSVSRWDTPSPNCITSQRGANSDVPGLFGLLTARGATFDRRARNPREKIIRLVAARRCGARGTSIREYIDPPEVARPSRRSANFFTRGREAPSRACASIIPPFTRAQRANGSGRPRGKLEEEAGLQSAPAHLHFAPFGGGGARTGAVKLRRDRREFLRREKGGRPSGEDPFRRGEGRP